MSTWPLVYPGNWDVELEGETFLVHRRRQAWAASDHLPVLARLRVRPSLHLAYRYVAGDALLPAE